MSGAPPPPAAPPELFARAYAGLTRLVDGLAEGRLGVPADKAEAIRAWRRGPCGGSGSLAKAAALLMRHEIGTNRLVDGAKGLPADDPEWAALQEVERVLWPPETEEIPPPVGVELSPELREALGPEARAVRMGALEAIFSPCPTLGGILSVSHPDRFPHVGEMRAARLAFGRGGPRLFMDLPAGDDVTGPPYVVKLFLRPPAEG